MKNKKTVLTMLSFLLILLFTAAPVLADAAPPVGDDITVDLPSSPYVVYPKDEDIHTKTPKFRFTDYSEFGATRYQIDVWEGTDASGTLVYTFKGKGMCNGVECWLQPTTPLKYYDYSGEKGQYFWRIRAKVAGDWPPLWSQEGFRVVSKGFTSTFDTDTKKWLELAGDWTLTSAGYLKTNGLLNTTATILHQHLFTTGYVYEVRMKRKVETDTTNRLFFSGIPGDTYTGGIWEDSYVFEYTNAGVWSFFRSDDYNKEYKVTDEPFTAIKPYGWNKLTVWRRASDICFWINEQHLGCYPDASYSEGWVGIGVYEGNADVSPLLVDWAKVWYSETPPYPMP